MLETVRIGKPTVNINGNKNFADKPINSTLLGLLLWPLHSNEHKILNSTSTSIFEKFKYIIKDFLIHNQRRINMLSN